MGGGTQVVLSDEHWYERKVEGGDRPHAGLYTEEMIGAGPRAGPVSRPLAGPDHVEAQVPHEWRAMRLAR